MSLISLLPSSCPPALLLEPLDMDLDHYDPAVVLSFFRSFVRSFVGSPTVLFLFHTYLLFFYVILYTMDGSTTTAYVFFYCFSLPLAPFEEPALFFYFLLLISLFLLLLLLLFLYRFSFFIFFRPYYLQKVVPI